jgi:hypothetical protein
MLCCMDVSYIMKPRSDYWMLVEFLWVIKLVQIDTGIPPVRFGVPVCSGTVITKMFCKVTLMCEEVTASMAATRSQLAV